MRDRLLGFGQAARDDLADIVELGRFIRRIEIAAERRGPGRRAGRGRRRFGLRGGRPGFEPFDIGPDDPAARAGAGHARKINALLFGDPARERRGDDAILARRPSGSRGRFRLRGPVGGPSLRWDDVLFFGLSGGGFWLAFRFARRISRRRSGRFVEILGHYDPRREPPEVTIDTERASYWIERGARPSDTVRSLLKRKANEAPEGAAAQEESA